MWESAGGERGGDVRVGWGDVFKEVMRGCDVCTRVCSRDVA